MSRKRFISVTALLFTVVLAWTGCGRDSVDSYRVPKQADGREPAPVVASPPPTSGRQAGTAGGMRALPGMEDQVSAIPGATWIAPDGWIEDTSNPMRKGSFRIPSASDGASSDLSITAFPGDVGGTAANINRWRGQIGLGSESPAAIADSLTSMRVGGEPASLCFLAPENPADGDPAILGAIVNRSTHTWFFKLTGPAGLLRAERERFVTFLETVRFVNGGTAP